MPPSVASAVFPIFKARAVRDPPLTQLRETAEGLGHAMWLIASCEVCKPRTEADGKLVTESNLTSRAPAQIPAQFGTPSTMPRFGAAAFQNRMFSTRCSAGARAVRVWRSSSCCASVVAHLDGQ